MHLGDGAEEGAHLRRLLFQLLTRSLASLKFFSKSREEAHFKEELLNLISLLFSRGFFQDPDFHFFQAVDAEVNTDVRMEGSRSALDQLKEALGLGAANSQPEHAQPVSPEKGSAQRSLSVLPMSSGAPAGEVPPLTIDGLQRQLIKKTNELILVQQCTRDFSVSYLPEHEDDALPFQGSLRSASRRSRSRGPKQRVVVSREKARSLAARRRAFNKVRDSFYYFDCHFSDMRNSCIIHIVIKLLTQIHEAKQLIRVQKTWNFVNNAIDAVAERSYSKNIEDLKQYLPRVRFDRFIQSAFEVHRHHEAAPGYTQALFYSSLFENFDLRKDCFGLMNRQLCVVRDAYKVYSSLVLLPDAHEAFLYRTIAIYADQLLISSRKALERPFFVNGSLLEKVSIHDK